MGLKNSNENLYKLLLNKKIILLIPGAIALAVGAALLIIAFVFKLLEPAADHNQVLNEHTESIINEVVIAKEYLSQFKDTVDDVNGYWEILTKDDYVPEIAIEALSFDIGEQINNLTANLGSLKLQINKSYSDITNLLNILEGLRADDSAAISDDIANIFYNLTDSLTDIHSFYITTFEDTKNLFADLSTLNLENNEELTEILKLMAEKMEADSAGNLNQLIVSISNIEQLNEERMLIIEIINEENRLQLEAHMRHIEAVLHTHGIDTTELANKNREELEAILLELGYEASQLANKNKIELESLIIQSELNLLKLANKNREDLEAVLLEVGFESNALANKNKDELEFLILQLGFNTLETASQNLNELEALLLKLGIDTSDQADKNKEELEYILAKLGLDVSVLTNKSKEELEYILLQFELNTMKAANQNKLELEAAIASLKDDTSSEARKNREELEGVLTELNNNLDGGLNNLSFFVQNNLGGLSDDISNLIVNSDGNINNRFGDLSNYLDSEFIGLAAYISQSFFDQTGGINSNVDHGFADLNSDLNSRFIELNNKIDTEFTKLFQSVSSGKTALAASLLTDKAVAERESILSDFGIGENDAENISFVLFANAIDEGDKIIADGKALLSNALKEKLQTIPNNASFHEIYHAILAIPINTNPDIISGEIEYIYHFHTTADGGNTSIQDSDSLDNSNHNVKGGCFQTEVRHTHSGSAGSGGGCYSVPVVHIHRDSAGTQRANSWTTATGQGTGCFTLATTTGGCGCKNFVEGWRVVHHSCPERDGGYRSLGWSDNPNPTNCPCGGGASKYRGCRTCRCNGSHNNTTGCTNGALTTYSLNCNRTIDSYTLGCGKTSETIEAYHTNCGRHWGEIVSARIFYPPTGD